MKKNFRKFTRLELLIVVAIIAVLLSLLLPSLGRAREKSKRVICMSNLKQMHLLSSLFSKNNNHKLISGYGRRGVKQSNYFISKGHRYFNFGFLYEEFPDELIGIMHCPSDTSSLTAFDTPQNPWPPKSGRNTRSSYNMNPIKHMRDKKNLPNLHDMMDKALYTDSFITKNTLKDKHVEGINVLYTEGFVKWFYKKSLPLDPLTSYGGGFSSPYQNVWNLLEEAK